LFVQRQSEEAEEEAAE